MKILFATDGSEHSESAARFISSFKFSEKDEIEILHAISWLPVMREWESLAEDFRTIREEVVPKILTSARPSPWMSWLCIAGNRDRQDCIAGDHNLV